MVDQLQAAMLEVFEKKGYHIVTTIAVNQEDGSMKFEFEVDDKIILTQEVDDKIILTQEVVDSVLEEALGMIGGEITG